MKPEVEIPLAEEINLDEDQYTVYQDIIDSFSDKYNAQNFVKITTESFSSFTDKQKSHLLQHTQDIIETDEKIATEFVKSYSSVTVEGYDVQGQEKLDKWIAIGKTEINPESSHYESYDSDQYSTYGKHFFRNTSPISQNLSLKGLDRWKDLLFSDNQKTNRAMHLFSAKNLEKIDPKESDIFLSAVEDLADKAPEYFEAAMATYPELISSLDLSHIKHLNTIQQKAHEKSENKDFSPFRCDISSLSQVKDVSSLLKDVETLYTQEKLTLAQAVLQNGAYLESLDPTLREKTISTAATFYKDHYYIYSSESALSVEAYTSYFQSIPAIEQMNETAKATWEQTIEANEKILEKEIFLKNASSFFEKVDPQKAGPLLDYQLAVTKAHASNASFEFGYLDQVTQLPSPIQNVLLHTGMRLATENQAKLSTFLRDTLPSMKQIQTRQQVYGIVEAAEKLEHVNPYVAREFLHRVGNFIDSVNPDMLQNWVDEGLDICYNDGDEAAADFFTAGLTRGFVDEMMERYQVVTFEDIAGAARLWISGFNLGEDNIMLEKSLKEGEAFTDGQAIYLPKQINIYNSTEKNTKVYMGLLDHEMAHLLYNSQDIRITDALEDYEKKDLAKWIYNTVEDGRIEVRLKHDYGPIIRDELDVMNKAFLLNTIDISPDYGITFLNLFLQKVKTGKTSQEVDPYYKDIFDTCYTIYQEMNTSHVKHSWGATAKIYEIVDKHFPAMVVPDQRSQLRDKPEDEQEKEEEKQERDSKVDPDLDRDDTISEKIVGTYKFDEWDNKRGDYLYEFTTVNVKTRKASSTSFYQETQQNCYDEQTHIISSFEEIKPGALKKESGLKDGAELNTDRYIETWIDKKAGDSEMDEHLYDDKLKTGRDVAAVILVDQSSSTIGDILKKEKEAMILMGDGLQSLGDTFSIYGFNSKGKDDVTVYKIKGFDEAYDTEVYQRIEAMEGTDQTRMGPAMRYAIDQLDQCNAATKIFIYLTDGAPEGYGGSPNAKGRAKDYAIADISKAVEEATDMGIQSYAVTIDSNMGDSLTEMFGAGNYCVISDIEELPEQIADYYKEVSDTRDG